MPARREQSYDAEQKARWQAMIDEATVDCYDEDEKFSGMLATLEDRGVASGVCHVLLAETVSHYDDELRD